MAVTSEAFKNNLASGQVAMNAATATEIVPARETERIVTIRNADASIGVYVGPTGLSAVNGFLMPAGTSKEFKFQGSIKGLAVSGTPSMHFIDEYE